MHEVDQHIVEASKQLDCSFVEEHNTIGSWKTEDIMEFLIRALWRIDSSTKEILPSCKIPPSINAKFSTAHKVAEKLNAMRVSPGMKLTEQSLLYGELSEYRRLFLDVIRLFPNLKDASGGGEEDEDLLDRVRKNMEDTEWTPFYCRNLHMRHKGMYWYPSVKNPELYPFNKKSDSGKRQDPRAFVVSVLTQGGKQQAIKPNLLPKPKIAPKPVKSTPQEETAGEEDPTAKEIARLKEELRNAQDQYDIAENETMQLEWEISRPKTPIIPISDELVATLKDPDTRAKLLHFLEQSDNKFIKLEEQWEAARQEKMMELQEARNLYGGTSKKMGITLFNGKTFTAI